MHTRKLSDKKNTLANRVNTELFPKLGNMEYDEIKKTFLSYIEDNTICMSQEARKRYHLEVDGQKSLIQIQSYVYNVGLKSDGMGVY